MKTTRSHFVQAGCYILTFLLFATVSALHADDTATKLVAGSKLPTLTVGVATYQNVTIRSVTARNAMITHDGGMKSLLLRDLSPELQQRFGYNPEAERAQEEAAKVTQAAAEKTQKARTEALKKNVRSRLNASRVDQLIKDLGTPPKIYREINLRPRFDELGFITKNQGGRPSCAIFSVVSALEYQTAEDRGTPERFSEEYVYWATRKLLGRSTISANSGGEAQQALSPEEQYRNDAGFVLPDVVTGLQKFGIINQDRLPNKFRGASEDPSEEIINDARYARKLSVQVLPGDSGKNVVENIVHALNGGLPVPAGMALPADIDLLFRGKGHIETRGSIFIRHAVTIVGYSCPTGRIEDCVFTFRNSWGARWGDKGYGTITYHALANNIMQAIVIELQ